MEYPVWNTIGVYRWSPQSQAPRARLGESEVTECEEFGEYVVSQVCCCAIILEKVREHQSAGGQCLCDGNDE